MDLYIRDLDEPNGCYECPFGTYLNCKDREGCPITAIPTPHSDLVELDKVIDWLRCQHYTIAIGDKTVSLTCIVEDTIKALKETPVAIMRSYDYIHQSTTL